MATRNNNAISTLNNLIETCRDGQNGFREAAEGTSNSEHQRLFNEYSQQRARFVSELQEEVQKFGGDPQDSGSVGAALHRGWINLKSAVMGKNSQQILEECEHGEDSAVRNYEDAMHSSLPTETSHLVQRQYESVLSTHDRIRNLRDLTRTAQA